jgi:PAS domain S-box-containing protein
MGVHPSVSKEMGSMREKITVLHRDVSQSAAAGDEAALLAAIVESSEDAIHSKTLDGRILSWNAGAQRIFGYTPEEAIGQPITLIVPPELRAEEHELLEKLRRGERIRHFETTRMARDGRRIPISLSVSPVRNSRGEIVAAANVSRDIAEWKATEQALRRSEEALREEHRRKDDFLATLAHELRNPLAPIRYAVAASRKPGLSEEKREQGRAIVERQLEHMSRLLDDLLDIARVMHNMLVLKKRRVELASLIGSAIETARPKIDAKGHQLLLDMPPQPIELDADPVRLAQVFTNLLINAAKYTNPGGRIELHARREHGNLIVSVRDNGIGIAPEMIPHLFTLFSQVDTALERSEGGLGIGLALVRGLVELHGGTVEARSDGSHCGSEFVVSLPVVVPMRERAARTAAPASEPAPSLRVLVADDNRDGADSCATLLELSGHTVVTAYNGREAFETAEQFRPDVALLDIGMPELNGYELARKIREQRWGGAIVLLAITGWGQEEDRRRALAAGFDHHLAKPIDPNQLDAVLRSIAVEQQDSD